MRIETKIICGKSIILFLAFISAVNVGYAQERFNLTFLTSPQLTWLNSDSRDVKVDKRGLGFGYGVEGDFFLGSGNYSLLTGLTVSTANSTLIYHQAITFNHSDLPADTRVNYHLKFIEVPLAIRMRTKDFYRTSLYAQFGLTNWLNIQSTGSTSDQSFHRDAIKDEVRFITIGLNVGVGINYDLGGRNALTGGIVYSNGFTDVTSNSTIQDVVTLRTVRLRLGFVF